MLLASINSPRLIRDVVNIGIGKNTPPIEQKYILLSNSINLTTLVLIPIYSILFTVVGFPLPGLVLIPVFFLMLIPLCLTAMQYYLTARVLLIGSLNVVLCMYALFFGREANLHFLYVVFATVPFLLFSLRQFVFIIPSWVLSFICFCIVRFSLLHIPLSANKESQTVISISMIALTFVWLTLNFYYLKRANASMSRSLIEQNTELLKEIERRKATEANMLKYIKDVEEKDRELKQLTHIAAHDLQEPLRTITSYTQLLQRQVDVEHNPAGETYMQFITEATHRLKKLMSDLLDYYDVTALSHTEKVNCTSLLKDIEEGMNSYIAQHHAVITYNDLPEVNANRQYFKILFGNLITNGIKFQKKGEMPVINISAEQSDNYWKFSVKDNGIGIQEKYFDKIFLIFQRLHNYNEYEGTGIGLALCQKIVELHGGKLWVESEEGKGSVFYFTLPVSNP